MERWTDEQNLLLKQYLFSSNCNFLQDSSINDLNIVASLITFYDLPINVMNCVDVGTGPLNYFRMLIELKKLNLDSCTIQCVSRILNS